jgi:hypothetical protein
MTKYPHGGRSPKNGDIWELPSLLRIFRIFRLLFHRILLREVPLLCRSSVCLN